ncbi:MULTISPECIES: hypothetical protein [Pseudomonas]|uniref:Uncharacterized protein n=1 Tax=Pseudomonas synxantha TaxID=47883 RepID=A0A5D3GHF9_9PSED|nr:MULTISPECIES: hypothetical protein [Pseudomonas]TYK60397.1 hypothetical protein FXO26_04590 [Pseudomonas synxantha]
MKKINSKPSENPMDLPPLDDLQLLALHAAVAREARNRGLSFNVGEIGEKLAIAAFKERPDLPVLAPSPRGTKNIDAISREGNRYSIKTLQRAKKSGTIYPDQSNNERQLFEFILIVLIHEDFTLERIIELDWQQFCAVRSWDIRMNAWYVARSNRVLSVGRQIYPRPASLATLPSPVSLRVKNPDNSTVPL